MTSTVGRMFLSDFGQNLEWVKLAHKWYYTTVTAPGNPLAAAAFTIVMNSTNSYRLCTLQQEKVAKHQNTNLRA